MIDIVLSDLDSTVCDVSHREHLAPADKADTQNWIPYSKACSEDTPIAGVVQTLQLLSKSYPIFMVSGRNVEATIETFSWLTEHSVPFTSLHLHSEDDLRHNGEYKVAYIEELRAMGYNPILMLEDSPTVSRMIEAAGVPVLRVAPPYVDNIGVSFNHITDSERTAPQKA